jgi:alkylated DNA repair dioxygenase AlkB
MSDFRPDPASGGRQSQPGQRKDQGTQMSLADVPTPAGDQPLEFDNDFAEIERHDLDEHSWIEVIPRLIRSPESLFEQLGRELDWSQRQRWIYNRKVDEPRLTADYPQIEDAPVAALRTLASRFSEIYDVPYDGVWVNLYRDQRDSTSWHGDYISCKGEICTVPVLTLGHPRRFLIKPRGGGKSTRFVPDSGDLIVMRGRCQSDWLHAVPKQTVPASARISVNFQSTAQMPS